MRNLLGTYLGFSGLLTLIHFMNTDLSCPKGPNVPAGSDHNVTSPSNSNGENGSTNQGTEMDSIVRGAIFYAGVALWGGSNRIVRSLTRGASAGGGGGGIVGVVLAAYEKVGKLWS